MLGMYDLLMTEGLAQARYNELLRQAEVERKLKAVKAGAVSRGRANHRAERVTVDKDLFGSLRNTNNREAERLGRQLGWMAYSCYSELIDRGLSANEAAGITKEFVANLVLAWEEKGNRRRRFTWFGDNRNGGKKFLHR